jgi:hypothetical protein
VLKRFRIAILLYILLFVALGELLARLRATDWDDTLWVDIYVVNGAGSEATEAYLDALAPDAFAAVERFFADQAQAHGLVIERPFGIRVAGKLERALPRVPDAPGMLGAIAFSLKMRWFATRLHWSIDGPAPDITLFAIYHDADSGVVLDRSTALRKGMLALANLFASRSAGGSNQLVVAHELLHTLGATDKYELATGQPLYPLGFADPNRKPLYPQSRAELMAGRVPIDAHDSIMPSSLASVVIGPATAREIGWQDAAGTGH